MAKKNETGKIASPSLWGKPISRPDKTVSNKTEKAVSRMRADDEENMDDEDIDVEAELAEEESYENVDEIEDDADAELVAEDDDADADDETDDEVADDDDEVEDDDDAEVEDDALTYASEEGDEAEETEEDENVVSAVDDDEVGDESDDDSDVAAGHTESRTRKMSEKKKVSLSDHVRAEIEKRKSSGASLRGVDIVAALEKRDITVSAAQVSQLLKKAGLGGGKRGRKPAAASSAPAAEKPRAAMKAKKREMASPAKAPVTRKPAPAAESRSALKAAPKAGNGFRVPLSQLQAAESFVEACGGSFKNAERILTAAANLSQTFGQ